MDDLSRRRLWLGQFWALCLSFVAVLFLCSTALAQTSGDSAYVLATEDLFSVTVLKHPEFSGDFLIPQSGIIQLPAVGEVHVEGLTLSKLSSYIRGVLAKTRLRHPEVSVTLKQPRVQRFYIVGDVHDSGVYDLKLGWGVAQALAASGGLAEGVQQADVNLTLERASGGAITQMSLTDALHQSGPDALKLQVGDTLRIEAVPLFPVYVSGKVKVPGVYRLRTDSRTVLAAISQAGGLADDASMKVQIVHPEGTESDFDLTPALVRGEHLNMPTLLPGDSVIVPPLLNRYAVLGYVTKPGYFPLPDGQPVTLSDAVALASGTSQFKGRITKIGLVRTVNGKQTQHIYDLDKYVKKGDLTQNPVIEPGDLIYVPQSNSVELASALSLVSVGALIYTYFRH